MIGKRLVSWYPDYGSISPTDGRKQNISEFSQGRGYFMEILLYEKTYERVKLQLKENAPSAVPVVMHDDGSLSRGGKKIEPKDANGNFDDIGEKIPNNQHHKIPIQGILI